MSRNALLPASTQFNHLVNWVDDMFNDYSGFEWKWPTKKSYGNYGNSNTYYKDGEYYIEVMTPGVTEDNIQLTVGKDGNLSLNVSATEETQNYEYREFRSYAFSRSYPLPAQVDKNHEATAILKNGILTIRCKLQKTAEYEPKKITVQKID